MPYNGAGLFTRIYQWVNDAALGLNVDATRTDTDSNDIAAGLSNCITRDGQSPALASIPMGGDIVTGVGGQKIIGMAKGVNAGDAVNFGQVFNTPSPFTGPVTFNAPISITSSVTGSAASSLDFSLATIFRVPTVAPGDNSTRAASTAFATQLSFAAALPAQPGGALRYRLQTLAGVASWSLDLKTRETRGSNVILGALDSGKVIAPTASFTQTFDTPANLGAGWIVRLEVPFNQSIVIPASDGLTNWTMYNGEIRDFFCDGVTLTSEVVKPFYVTFTASVSMTKPPGYDLFGAFVISGGQSGQRTNNLATISVGGHGGGAFPALITASKFGASQSIVVGAGGAPVVGVAIGTVGGDSAVGTLIVVKGGGTPSLFNGSITCGGAIAGSQGTTTLGVGFESRYQAGNSIYGGITADVNASTNGSTSTYGAGCGGCVDGSGVIRLPGISLNYGNGGAAHTNTNGVAGVGDGAGGGATQTGAASGAGVDGSVRVWGIA